MALSILQRDCIKILLLKPSLKLSDGPQVRFGTVLQQSFNSQKLKIFLCIALLGLTFLLSMPARLSAEGEKMNTVFSGGKKM